MNMSAAINAGDLASSFDHFTHAISAFATAIAGIGWGYLAAGLLLALACNIARAHAWANALRAAYPGGRVNELRVVASFLAGAGMNAALPARGGDAIKIVLAKRSVEDSAYPAIISSFGALAPFDAAAAFFILFYAATQGLLPSAPRLPSLPAFEISFWAEHPVALAIVVGSLIAGAFVLGVVLARRLESFWEDLKLGLSIFRQPRRYLRGVASWQAVAWTLRFASFWMLLEAFHIPASFEVVLLVMSVQAIAGSLPFTPGGIGSSQALLVATLNGPSRTAVLAYSVGQQIAITAWSLLISVVALVLVFRITDWRRLIHEGDTARAEARAGGG
jgi:glycosyltransferase 2 family protein